MKSSNFICTIGPTNNSPERIERMIYKGMSVARLNMSHGTHEEHEKSIRNVRTAADRFWKKTNYQAPVAIAIDLSGQEIRLGHLCEQFDKIGQPLSIGNTLRFHHNAQLALEPTPEIVFIDHDTVELPLRRRQMVYIDDGRIALVIDEIYGGIVTCKVTKPGILRSHLTIFFPDIAKEINFKKVTDKDKVDLEFAVRKKVDFIFASHVESSEWIDAIRSELGEKGQGIEILAKIQNTYGVENIEDILGKADGIIFKPTMAIDPTYNFLMQTLLLMRCKKALKQCFVTIKSKLVSTNMYEAVYWAIHSVDGVMMTHEATEGNKMPLETMTVLTDIKTLIHDTKDDFELEIDCHDIDTGLAAACAKSSILVKASVIIIIGNSKKLVHYVHCHEPKCQIVAVVTNPKFARQLNILERTHVLIMDRKLPVTPIIFDRHMSTTKLNFGLDFAIKRGITKSGDSFVLLRSDIRRVEVHYVPY